MSGAADAQLNVENFKFVSVEYLYNFLRFHAFPEVSDEKKKAIFKTAISVPLREPSLFAQVTESVNNNDFQMFQRIIESSAITTKLKIPSTWHTIVDAYFDEKNKDLALKLFRYLLFLPVTDEKLLYDCIKQYKSMTQDERAHMLGNGVVYHSMVI